MTSRSSWIGYRGSSLEDLKSDVRKYFIKKSRNVWIRELLDSQFDSFFFDLFSFVIEHQITNNRLNRKESHENRLSNINSAKVDKFFFESVVNDVAVYKDNRILSQIKKELLKNEKWDAFDSKRNKSLKELLSDLLLFCVEADRSSALKCILEWIKDLSEKGSLKLEIKAWNEKDKKKESTKGFTYNSEALIRACEKNNFEMVGSFLSICFCDGQIKFTLHDGKFEFDRAPDNFKGWFHANTKILSGEFNRHTSGFLNFFRIFFAKSTPAYLVAKFQFSNEKGKLCQAQVQVRSSLGQVPFRSQSDSDLGCTLNLVDHTPTKFSLLSLLSSLFSYQVQVRSGSVLTH